MREITDNDLHQFCDRDAGLRSSRPWNFKGFRYAADGRCAIRIPTSDPDSTDTSEMIHKGDIAGAFPEIGDTLGNWSEAVPVLRVLSCIECGGGRYVGGDKCSECDGDGVKTCPTCRIEHDCRKCDGSGLVNRKRCRRCVGKGGPFEQVIAYQFPTGHAIATKFYDLIARLPNVRFDPSSPIDKGLRFSFDGGDGAVMRLHLE